VPISHQLRNRIREQAGDRCGYCLSSQKYVLALLEIEHIHPISLGGTDDESNLWLACRLCNGFKGQQTHGYDPASQRQVKLFNPRRQKWVRHFVWNGDGTLVIGRTACGRATVEALKMNNPVAIMVRQQWVDVGWHPPKDL
jgi:HNH endonuclease